jgi:hypothetical protein
MHRPDSCLSTGVNTLRDMGRMWAGYIPDEKLRCFHTVRENCTPCHDCKRRKVQLPTYYSVIVASLDRCRKSHVDAEKVCETTVISVPSSVDYSC